MNFDSILIKSLFANPVIKERFFIDIDGIAVFDKIGLTNSKCEYINESHDVELVFPYKDCILEGGQTKEDRKRDEIFYNEHLHLMKRIGF
jgi:adenine-specific DNA-methyltransferase